jgi:hypothetical protein
VQSTESSGGSPATPPASGARQPDFAQGSLAPLRTAHFAADARRALAGDLHALAVADATSGQLDSAKAAPSPSATPSVSAETPACPGPTQAGTVGAVVRLDGQAAALVVHPPQGGSRLVQAWSCDGSTLLASARVPVG